MARRAAIVGVGLTKCSSHRKDVTYPELIYEAVSGALAQANLQAGDIDAVVYGSMDPFDGVFAPERWNVDACVSAGFLTKPFLKITTGGTFRFRRKLLHLANALTDQLVGLEETDDGIWAIHFNTVLIATFDERDYIIRG